MSDPAVQNLQGTVDALAHYSAQITRDSAANTTKYDKILTTLADFRSSITDLVQADKNHTSALNHVKGELADVKKTLATHTTSHTTIGLTLQTYTTSHETTLAAVQNVSNEQHAAKDA